MKDRTATLAGLFIGAAAVGVPLGVRAARWYRCEPARPNLDRLRTARKAN
jgi:hypothetical protein